MLTAMAHLTVATQFMELLRSTKMATLSALGVLPLTAKEVAVAASFEMASSTGKPNPSAHVLALGLPIIYKNILS